MKMNKSVTYHPHSSGELAFTATPQDITPPDDIYIVRFVSDQDCEITWKNAGTVKLISGIPEYFQCHPGDAMSVERASADGNLDYAWMTN